MIGTTAAIILAASSMAASSASQAYGAKKQGDAAEATADAQMKASDRSAELMAQQYALAQQRLAPYQQIGGMAADNLGAMMRGPGAPTFTPGQQAAWTPPPMAPQAPPPQMPMPQRPMLAPGRGRGPLLPPQQTMGDLMGMR